MKKLLLSLILGLGLTNFASASHMMGGQITIEHIGGMDYRVVYTAYRDMTGIPIAQVASINFMDSVSGNSFIVPIPYDSAVTVLVPGVEEYVYDTIVTFPNMGSWYVSYEECCRNAAILNMTQPGGESHHFYSIVQIDSSNSTPVFLNPPIVLAQENVPFYYNPLPFDVDGDSIAWSLDIPLSSNGTPVVGYVLPSSDSLVPFNMDPVTGEITFLPNMLGNFQVSVRVKEYRNGVQIGEITRDMQLIVVQSLNVPAVLMISSNSAPFNGKAYTIAPGAAFSMNVTIFDQDNQGVTIVGRGEPFGLPFNPATLNVVNGTGSATATVSWTPDASQDRPLPYVLGLRVSENYGNMVFQSDISVSLKVGLGVTGINENTKDAQVALSPNPTSDQFNIQFVAKSTSEVAIEVMAADGKSAAKFVNSQVATGLNVIQVHNLHLAKGIYIVQLVQDGKALGMQRLVIQ
jgi:Secretion system C-terminal sorting domain